jgi:hypothetical protein
MSPGQHKPGIAGFKPDRGVSAQPVRQEDGVVGFTSLRGCIDLFLQHEAQPVAVLVLPLFGELYIHRVGAAGDAVADLPGQNVTGDKLEVHD